jgi:hypothetical protein
LEKLIQAFRRGVMGDLNVGIQTVVYLERLMQGGAFGTPI